MSIEQQVVEAVTVSLSYPCTVIYCPNCSFPPDLCEFSPNFEGCKPWLRENYPELLEKMEALRGPSPSPAISPALPSSEKPEDSDAEPQAITAPSASSEGAQTAPPKTDKKKKAPQIEDAKVVTISVHHRSKKKKITEITGLQAFGLKPKDLIKFFSNKFACSVSVNKAKADEIDVQGDFSYDVAEILQEKYSIPEDSIVIKQDRSRAGAEDDDDDDDDEEDDDDDDEDDGKPKAKGKAKGKGKGKSKRK